MPTSLASSQRRRGTAWSTSPTLTLPVLLPGLTLAGHLTALPPEPQTLCADPVMTAESSADATRSHTPAGNLGVPAFLPGLGDFCSCPSFLFPLQHVCGFSLNAMLDFLKAAGAGPPSQGTVPSGCLADTAQLEASGEGHGKTLIAAVLTLEPPKPRFPLHTQGGSLEVILLGQTLLGAKTACLRCLGDC